MDLAFLAERGLETDLDRERDRDRRDLWDLGLDVCPTRDLPSLDLDQDLDLDLLRGDLSLLGTTGGSGEGCWMFAH